MLEVAEPKRQHGFTDIADNGGIEITIAPNAGACFGVVRAIKLGHAALDRNGGSPAAKKVFSFGPLIHNPKVVGELEAKGAITTSDPEQIDEGTVLLRSHGVQKEIEAKFKERGVKVIDATCPLVKKPQRIASSLGAKGYFLILVGDEKHPEVKGVLSYFGRPDYLVTYKPEDLEKIPSSVAKVGILAQTTIEIAVLNQVIERAKQKYSDVLVYNTICDATSVRQDEALELAKAADIVIVVGGKNSSNTTKLVKICKSYQPDTFHIESTDEISREWFVGKRKIGITGGASTPHEFVDQVGTFIAAFFH